MHFYCYNDAVPWLNKAKSQIFRCSVSCQFSDIGSHNQLSNEQKWSESEQKKSISEQTRSFAQNVP